MKRIQTIVSTNAPSQRDVLWAKPLSSINGFTLYLYANKEWRPFKTVDDKGTSNLSDDEDSTVTHADLDLRESMLKGELADIYANKLETEMAIEKVSSKLTDTVFVTGNDVTLDENLTQERGHNVYTYNLEAKKGYLVLGHFVDGSDVIFNLPNIDADNSKLTDTVYISELVQQQDIEIVIMCECRIFFEEPHKFFDSILVADSISQWVGYGANDSPSVIKHPLYLKIKARSDWFIEGNFYEATTDDSERLIKKELTSEYIEQHLTDDYLPLTDGRVFIFPPNNRASGIELGLPIVTPNGKGHIKLELHAEAGTYTFSSETANLLIQSGIAMNLQDTDYFLDCKYYNNKWYITGQMFSTPPVNRIQL